MPRSPAGRDVAAWWAAALPTSRSPAAAAWSCTLQAPGPPLVKTHKTLGARSMENNAGGERVWTIRWV